MYRHSKSILATLGVTLLLIISLWALTLNNRGALPIREVDFVFPANTAGHFWVKCKNSSPQILADSSGVATIKFSISRSVTIDDGGTLARWHRERYFDSNGKELLDGDSAPKNSTGVYVWDLGRDAQGVVNLFLGTKAGYLNAVP